MNRHWHRSLEDRTCYTASTRQEHRKQAAPSTIRRPKKLDTGYEEMAGSHVSIKQMDLCPERGGNRPASLA